MSLSEPLNPITFVVAIAGHTSQCGKLSFKIVASKCSDITPTYIATQVNDQHEASCPCPWRGSRNYIYAHELDISDDDFARDCLRDMSPSNPPDVHALIPSVHDWPVPSEYTAHLSANPDHAHFIICREINKDSKRKAPSSGGVASTQPSKQRKLAKTLPIIVKNFGDVRIIQIGDKLSAPKGCSLLPTDLYTAFHTTNRRAIVVDQTRMLVRAFRTAETFGWGFYCSPESFEDMRAALSSLMTFMDLHPKYANSFERTFGYSFVSDWMSMHPEFDFHSRTFVLGTAEAFAESIEHAIHTSVKQAVNKYREVPGMETLGEVVEGCKGGEALRRILHYLSERRPMLDIQNCETAIIVEGYDLAARVAHSSDITAGPASPAHVSLAQVTRCFKAHFYDILTITVDPVSRNLLVQRLILQGTSPAFMEDLCLSFPVTDLSHLSGVPGLTLAQTAAHIAFMNDIDDPDDSRVKHVMSILKKTCPSYTYTSAQTNPLTFHFPRKYLRTYFSAFAKDLKPSETAVRNAITSIKKASPTTPYVVFEALCTLYGQGSLFWEHDVTSDLLNEKLEVRSEEGLCLRFSYCRTPMDTLPPNSSTREIKEITPVHMAQVLFEEGLLTWRRIGTQCYYRFPSAAVKTKFVREIVERSALKTRQLPATFREPAVTWIKDVLSDHLVKRPLSSVIYLTENVGQTAVEIITEVSLPVQGDLCGRSFLEVMTQRGKRIDTAMLILQAALSLRAQLHFWEFKNIPIADLYEATYCCRLPRNSAKQLTYGAHRELENFMKTLDAFPASEWNAADYSDNPSHWPNPPSSPPAASWKPTKLRHLFYWGYDNSDKTRPAVRVKCSIFRTMWESDRQVWGYGLEAARHGPPTKDELPPTHNTKDFPDVGGLRDPRIQALLPSAKVEDYIRLGIVIVVAGRFVITRDVGSAQTKREFRATE
ncbi:hypothetical protein BDZ89DRAFT_1063232 [Hymenopellis radicata]|nr:hypothetical protein BDZ89DRAFT_1063232 [Hymenopellis radicata]